MIGRSVCVLLIFALAFATLAKAGEDIIGKKAPDFTLRDLDGNSVSLEDFRGKVLILDFWAVWCGPCQMSLPFFQKMSERYGNRGLEVVGLHVDDRMPGLDSVRDYLEDRRVHYTNLLSTFEVDEAFQVYAMPTTYLIDRDGRIAKLHVGFQPGRTPEELEKSVREMLRR